MSLRPECKSRRVTEAAMWVNESLRGTRVLVHVLQEFRQSLGRNVVAPDLGRCRSPRTDQFRWQRPVQRRYWGVAVVVPVALALVAALQTQTTKWK